MQFFTRLKDEAPTAKSDDGIYLVRDHWNDFWKYQTMFDVFYVERENIYKYIGKIKIGMKNLKPIEDESTGHDLLKLPLNFTKLGTEYFSLGQSSEYYKNIKGIFNSDDLKDFLISTRDIVHDISIYESYRDEFSMTNSILRDYSHLTIKGEFKRILTGEAELTNFKFNFYLEGYNNPLQFHVKPKSLPPTNIHILIGRNGVGKTRFLSKMIDASTSTNIKNYFTDSADEHIDIKELFASLVMVSFSTFDNIYPINIDKSLIKYKFIGLKSPLVSGDEIKNDSLENLKNDFYRSLSSISENIDKVNQWYKAIETLSEDNVFSALSVS